MKKRLRLSRRFLPLAALAAILAAPAVRADLPTSGYYPDALITLPPVPDAADVTNIVPVARAMNHQGYILAGDASQIRTNSGAYVVRAPYLYVNKTLHPLSMVSLDVNHVFVNFISDTAADGTFWVAGRYDDQQSGFRHPVRWHIAADGTSGGPEVLRNRILPPDSSAPGEQGTAEPLGIAIDGTIAGFSQSYLVNVPQVWFPGDTAAHDIPGLTYPGSAQGIAPGGGIFGIHANDDGTSNPVLGQLTLNIPSDNYYWELDQFYAGRMVGSRLALNSTAGSSRAFVYDIAAGTTTDLPGIGSLHSEDIYYNDHAYAINASGDIVGLGGSYLFGVLWKRDAATGGYTPFRIDRDLGYTALNGTTYQFRGGDSDYSLTGIADDGSVAVSRVQNYLDGSWGIIVEKPGPDPRPVITPTDPTISNGVQIDAKPGQPVRYQFTATNNPTSFQLYDPVNQSVYALPAGLSFNSATGLLSGTGPARGVYTFQVVATNGRGYGAFPATVTIASGDKPALADQSATAHLNQPFTYQVAFTGSVTSIYAYPLPDGLSMDQTGKITGTPTALGTTTGTIYASNDIGQSTAQLTITVDNQPPVVTTSTADLVLAITSSANTVSAGRQVTYTLTLSNNDGPDTAVGIKGRLVKPDSFTLVSSSSAVDADGNTLSFSARDLAKNANETITFTFLANTAGTYTLVAGFTADGADPSPQNRNGSITTTVQDAAAAGTADLGLTVVDSPDPVVVGQRITYTFTLTNNKAGSVTATNIQGSFVKDSKMTLVPSASTPGIIVNGNVLSFPLPDLAAGPAPQTFVLVFTADSAGIDTIGAGVQADQSDPHTADNGLLETTEARAGTSASHAPVITASAGGVIVAGDGVNYVVATDGTTPVDSITASGLPDGLSVDSATGKIIGTTAADLELGAYAVTFRAVNGAGASTATRTFTVVAPPAGLAADLSGALTDASVALDSSGNYQAAGSFTITNLGAAKAKGLEVGVYLSTSPTVLTPVTAGDPSLLPLPLKLVKVAPTPKNPSGLKLKIDVTKLGSAAPPLVVPVKIKQAGKAAATLTVKYKFPVPAALLAQASARYRYAIIVLDPANKFAEADETNNTVFVDLQTAVTK